jgi:hypothetical protein
MKKYIHFIFYLLLLLSCKKDSPIESQIPDNGGGNNAAKLPTLITNPNTDLTRYSTKVTGSLTDSGDSKIIEAGFVVDTVPSPTVLKNLNKFIKVPDQNGLMLVIITNIPANKTYYIRSYAKNTQGTGYGNEVKFTSLPANIFQGNVTLSTQQQMEEFGNKKYTTIDGSLEITGSVTDLSPLKNLAVINYRLQISNASQLTTLEGMDSLEAVNASYFFHGMRIENNKALKSLKGLEKLAGNNGYLYIINNDEFTDLNGLNNLLYNHFGELRIEGCDKLRNLHGLEKFNWLDGDIMIKDNPVLTDIAAFGNLNFITGRIRIMNNASLQNVNGFEKLHNVEGIELHDNKMLSDLKGFSNLDTITSIIFLKNNSALKDLSSLEKITTTEYLTLENSPALISLKGLQNLKTVKHKIKIWNSGLTNMNGLENLNQTQHIELVYNERLENLLGLSKLTTFAGNAYSLTISYNNQLKSLSGLDNVTKAEGMIYIGFNRMLNDFCPLKPLLKSGFKGTFYIEGNAVNPDAAEVRNNCP